MRLRICATENSYSGSTDTTLTFRCCASALNDAGPSPHPRIDRDRSVSSSENIATYSSKLRPQGTTSASRNVIETPTASIQNNRDSAVLPEGQPIPTLLCLDRPVQGNPGA